MKYKFEQLINRNYESTIKRGKITDKTTHYEFIKKITEENNEFMDELTNIDISKPVGYSNRINYDASIEIGDIITVCFNYLIQNHYDPFNVLELVAQKNELRQD